MSLGSEDDWDTVPHFYNATPVWKTATVITDRFQFQAKVGDSSWFIRLNDFPEEPLWSLIVDDVEIIHFSDWPETWGERPALPVK